MTVASEEASVTVPRKLTLYNYKCVAFAAMASIIIGYSLSAVATTLVRMTFHYDVGNH